MLHKLPPGSFAAVSRGLGFRGTQSAVSVKARTMSNAGKVQKRVLEIELREEDTFLSPNVCEVYCLDEFLLSTS